MKTKVMLLMSILLLVSCNRKVEISVFNNSEVDRVNETVELCLCELTELDAERIVVLDAKGKQVPCQILYKGTDKAQCLVFQVSLKAGTEALYTLTEGERENFPDRTYAQFVSKRKDDFSWENDRIAFRMYGPALANENPSNGVDVWFKRTEKLITDEWYANDLNGVRSYHDDHGEGLDCYKVAHTLGAGSVCPITGDSLWVGGHYNRYKILDNGPVRTSFVLFWDSIPCCGKPLKAEMLVNLDAGSQLNEVRIRYSGKAPAFRLAAGIYLHDTIQSIANQPDKGFIGYAEDLISQGKKPVPSGRGYFGVVFPELISETRQVADHLVAIADYKVGEEFRYYFGAGWSKFGFASDQEWFSYLNARAQALRQPLKVKILK